MAISINPRRPKISSTKATKQVSRRERLLKAPSSPALLPFGRKGERATLAPSRRSPAARRYNCRKRHTSASRRCRSPRSHSRSTGRPAARLRPRPDPTSRRHPRHSSRARRRARRPAAGPASSMPNRGARRFSRGKDRARESEPRESGDHRLGNGVSHFRPPVAKRDRQLTSGGPQAFPAFKKS